MLLKKIFYSDLLEKSDQAIKICLATSPATETMTFRRMVVVNPPETYDKTKLWRPREAIGAFCFSTLLEARVLSSATPRGSISALRCGGRRIGERDQFVAIHNDVCLAGICYY